jgi:hypothetical protein
MTASPDTAPPRGGIAAADTRRIAVLTLAVFALFAVAQLVRYLATPEILYPDFFGLWSFERFPLTHPVDQIYDQGILEQFQRQIGPGFTDSYPFLYPPPFLVLFWPLGQIPYGVARPVWLVVSLAAALFGLCGARWRQPLTLAGALAPATTVCMIYGQNGLLSAALMIGGLRVVRTAPMLGGALFGLLIYKPQLGVLIPVALLAAGLWRAIAAAAASAAALCLVATALYGWGMWPEWLAAARGVARLSPADQAHFDRLMPTVSAAARRLGAGADAVTALQLAAAGIACVCVWRCWRRNRGLDSDAALPVATVLATPFAFGYDLPMVAFAVLIALAERARRLGRFGFGELLTALLVLLLPIVFVSTLSIGAPLAVLLLAALLWILASPAG